MSKGRTIAKTVTWRITASSITVIIIYTLTGDFAISTGASLAEILIKTIAYYIHERVWK